MQRDAAWKEETLSRLWELHPVERLSALSMTVVQCNSKDTRAAIKGMLAIIRMMSKLHSVQTRGVFANDCRDAADVIEQPIMHVVN